MMIPRSVVVVVVVVVFKFEFCGMYFNIRLDKVRYKFH